MRRIKNLYFFKKKTEYGVSACLVDTRMGMSERGRGAQEARGKGGLGVEWPRGGGAMGDCA